MKFWLPHWRIVQLCKITMDDGTVGWGETIPNYTWSKVPTDIEDRIVGKTAADLLWDDALGAGVQMALFDAVGKKLGTPGLSAARQQSARLVSALWWAMDMPAKDWARQCADAVKAGYMTPSSRRAPGHDLHNAIGAIIKVVPPQFKL